MDTKWKRGLGLPDITIIKNLAKTLDVSVNDILNGGITEDKTIDIEKELSKLKKKIDYQLTFILVLVIVIIILKNISFGYKTKKVYYNHASKNTYINVGVPKTSFLMKYRDKSYSFKKFRNANILENEVKNI